MTMLETLAQAMCRELGWEFDSLYESKREWIDDRGARHDINTPRKPDAIDAVRAVLRALRDSDEGMVNAIYHPDVYADDKSPEQVRRDWRAMIDHILRVRQLPSRWARTG